MLIGAHVSPAGGPAKAVERGAERGCDAIQIFNQNPRAWKPTAYSDERSRPTRRIAGSAVQALAHPRRLPAERRLRGRRDPREDARLAHRVAARRAAPGRGRRRPAPRVGARRARSGRRSSARARSSARRWPSRTGCALHLENTAGAGGTLGRSFGELAALLERGGRRRAPRRLPRHCHLYASGYDVRTAEGLARVLDDFDAEVGLGRLRSLHLNDSQVGLGSNRDRHAVVGKGELGDDGCAVFLSEPRFADLPCILETPDPDLQGPAEMSAAPRCASAARRRAAGARPRAAAPRRPSARPQVPAPGRCTSRRTSAGSATRSFRRAGSGRARRRSRSAS